MAGPVDFSTDEGKATLAAIEQAIRHALQDVEPRRSFDPGKVDFIAPLDLASRVRRLAEYAADQVMPLVQRHVTDQVLREERARIIHLLQPTAAS